MDSEPVAKRTRAACKAAAAQAKEAKLKLDEMIIVFQFLPTHELTPFLSNLAKPLLGKFWSVGLNFVVERRFPLSIHQLENRNIFEMRDRFGTKVAIIRRSDFCFSPLCKHVGRAELGLFLGNDREWVFTRRASEPFLAASNVQELILTNHSFNYNHMPGKAEILQSSELAAHAMSTALSRLKLFSLTFPCLVSENFVPLIRHMTSLTKLMVPAPLLELLLPDNTWFSPAAVGIAESILGQLESLSVAAANANRVFSCDMQPILRSIPIYCTQLRKVYFRLVTDARHYVAAFRGLPQLSDLRLDVNSSFVKQLPAGPVGTVKNLQLTSCDSRNRDAALRLLPSFPNVVNLALETGEEVEWQFAAELCAKKILPELQRLQLFCPGDRCRYASGTQRSFGRFTSENVVAFIQQPHLPSELDLSEAPFVYSPQHEADFLVGLFRAMQINSVGRLALRGPVHRDAVARLQEQFDGDGSGRILAWRDLELGAVSRSNPCRNTDYKISGTKAVGQAKGEPFIIRISHRLQKRADIYEQLDSV